MADEIDDEALTSIAAALAGCPRVEFKDRLRQRLERSITMMTAAEPKVQAPGARAGFTAVTPYLMAPDIEPVVTFAKIVFGADETVKTAGGGGGLHYELRIGDSMLMCGGGAGTFNPTIPTRQLGLQIYVDDVDAVFQRALAAGGTSLGEPEDRPYGERSGFVKDQVGNNWYISKRIGADAAPPPRTMTPHLYVEQRPGRTAADFIDFLQRALGAQVAFRHDSPDGLVAHAVVELHGAAIGIGEGREAGFAAPAAFYLYVDDCDALYNQAISAGAKGTHAPADQVYGDRMGTIEDPWGNEWFIATHLQK